MVDYFIASAKETLQKFLRQLMIDCQLNLFIHFLLFSSLRATLVFEKLDDVDADARASFTT
jgi:hypothetical protein